MAVEQAIVSIGRIEVDSIGNTKIIGLDGVIRDVAYEGFVYDGEQIVSDNPETRCSRLGILHFLRILCRKVSSPSWLMVGKIHIRFMNI